MKKFVLAVPTGLVLAWLVIAGTVSGQTTAAPTPTSAPNQAPPPPPPPGGGPTVPPITPPCPPSGCATSTPAATPTPTVTPTATPVPLRLSVTLAHGTVNPRQRQQVVVRTAPGATLYLEIGYPNGDVKQVDDTVNAAGRFTYSYVQPGSRITRTGRTATVTVDVSLGSSIKHSVKRYTIGFARLDVSVQPRRQSRGSAVNTWVHSYPRTRFTVRVQYPRSVVYVSPTQTTGSDGWAYLRLLIPRTITPGSADVKARAQNSSFGGETSFRVR